VADVAAGIQTRRILIDMARKRQRPGSGSAPELLQGRTTRLRFPDLAPILSPIRWAVVGAAAARLYMAERMTDDLDILVRAQDIADVRNRLTRVGATHQGKLGIGRSSWILADGFPLDVIECREEWAETALAEAQVNRDAEGMPILPLQFLVLMKFLASRMQDLADIARMLGQASEEQRASVRAAFAQWLPAETEDLESLIVLGQMELQPTSPPESE